MKMKLLWLPVCALIACTHNKKYHIAVGKSNGEIKLDSCSVATDSAAYRKGAEAFLAETMAYSVIKDPGIAKYLGEPKTFVVTDDEGYDVKPRLTSRCLNDIKAEMMHLMEQMKSLSPSAGTN